MTRWILAAEADKIQHFVFRSAHLREVVGGSQLLTSFCREGTRELLAHQRGKPLGAIEKDVLVADGGSFSILFDGEDGARRFGQALAQLYWDTTGSTLTVAEPVLWNGDFAAANEASRQALRRAKDQGRPALAGEHLPYAAFCASCGVGLADRHASLHQDERANYLCASCHMKGREDIELRTEFKTRVVGDDIQGFNLPAADFDKHAEGWDPRQYVAYLVADGNGMGQIFDECSSATQMKQLSEGLTEVLYQSLADPTQLLMAQAPSFRQWEVPMLPLILGGDDVFVRLPAPYALDFARRFCQEYEQQMEQALEALGMNANPTMAAAVVICKSKYPHSLAHQHGHRLLEKAKQLSKSVALEHGAAHSVVHFDVIRGSRLAESPEEKAEYRASLRPYWVVEEDGTLSPQVGLPLHRLIGQRYELRALPARRLAQLRALFVSGQLPKKDEEVARWHARLGQIVGRVARSQAHADALDTALTDLGGQVQGWWYQVSRPGYKQKPFWGHGLPDLLDMWDFCLDLDRDRSEYEELGR